MASEESESSSSGGLGDRSSSPASGHSPKTYARRTANQNFPTKKQSRRTIRAATDIDSRTGRPRADSLRPIFRAETIDPEVDKAIVVDAVHFVLSASSQGCYSLISKIAEHLKYKISLEEKIMFLTKELKDLRKLPSSFEMSAPITLESQTSRLKKPCVTYIKEPKVAEQGIDTEFILPGIVPSAAKTRSYQSSNTLPSITVSEFKDKAFGSNDSVTVSLPKISTRGELVCGEKSSADTQTVCASSRKPIMVERASSPDIQIDSYVMLQDQLSNAQVMITQLNAQLALSQKEMNVAFRDTGTQTDFRISRKPELVERGCSPNPERGSHLQQVSRSEEKSENEVYSPASTRDLEHRPCKKKGTPTRFNRSRSPSVVSSTNDSTQSYPGVKSKRHKCSCATCSDVRKQCIRSGK